MGNGLTDLVFIIDRSGSMEGLEEDVVGGFNAMLKEQQALEGEAAVTTVLFDHRYRLLHDRADLRAVAPLTRADYRAEGSTALLDAVGRTIRRIREARRDVPGGKVLFFIITDGYENASRHYTADMIRERIRRQREEHGWEFVFLGADMDAVSEAGKLGIAPDRARSWHGDSIGTRSAYTAASELSTAFRTGGPLGGAPAGEAQTAGEALRQLKEIMGGLNRAAEELTEALEDLKEEARAHGGRIPDVNEILRRVLAEGKKEER